MTKKITFIGAGSTIFAKNLLGDCMLSPALQNFEFALYDIDAKRLQESENMLNQLKKNLNSGVAVVSYHERIPALQDASYVINAIQVGGYKPSTVIDFDIPKRFGLEQTIGDTIGIGGIFRALRTIPVMLDIAKDMEKVCPDAWLLNYTNPMASLCGVLQRFTSIKTVGLCHSVQVCTSELLKALDMPADRIEERIAGINHMAWLLEIKRDGVDLYPEIKKRAKEKQKTKHNDMVRFELMDKFGFYVTESSEHNAEYHPYFIKRNAPELIEQLNIPLDEYPRRCEQQIADWEQMRDNITQNEELTHERSHEYGSRIIEAMETNVPFVFAGNVLNEGGLISNLPSKAVVEVPCIADRNGIKPSYMGELPEQLAALNRSNISTQLMTIEAAMTGSKSALYQAAFLDPHTGSELTLNQMTELCDALLEAHGEWIPYFKEDKPAEATV